MAKDAAKKPNWFVRTGKAIGKKVKEVFSELKKVTWPTFPKVLKSTGVVIAVVLIFIVAVTAVDAGLSQLLKLISSLG